MKIIETSIPGVQIIQPTVFGDDRGFFFEKFNARGLQEAGICFTPIQENCAFSLKKGTIRGLHFQNDPVAQAKIVCCVRGSVVDYAVDFRKGSPTYLQYVSVALSADNRLQLYIPRGFAHGVISTEDNSMIEYFADNPYSPTHDRSVRYDDPQVGINWGATELILSPKDKNAPFLVDSDCNFVWSGDDDR